jgi:tetracycline resistance efflux pump
VQTQLPYALAVAAVSCVGFISLGLTASVLISFIAASVAFVLMCVALSVISRSKMAL